MNGKMPVAHRHINAIASNRKLDFSILSFALHVNLARAQRPSWKHHIVHNQKELAIVLVSASFLLYVHSKLAMLEPTALVRFLHSCDIGFDRESTQRVLRVQHLSRAVTFAE